MYIGGSLFLIALGAILKFAVQDNISGIDLQTTGVICMIVGAIGIVASLVLNGQRERGVRRDELPPR